jgi:hypothetical protein
MMVMILAYGGHSDYGPGLADHGVSDHELCWSDDLCYGDYYRAGHVIILMNYAGHWTMIKKKKGL